MVSEWSNPLSWVLYAMTLVLVVDVITRTYWRTLNLRRQLRYRFSWRNGRWCTHTQHPSDPSHWVRAVPGMAWSRWATTWHDPGSEWRACTTCGWEQRRPARGLTMYAFLRYRDKDTDAIKIAGL